MSHSISISDFYDICRICLETKENMLNVNSEILCMLEECSSVQVNKNKSKFIEINIYLFHNITR